MPASEAGKRAMSEGFGYEVLTEVQEGTLARQEENLLVRAETGAGKTLGFLLPLFERLAKSQRRKGVGAVVVSPVRELTLQIFGEAARLAAYYEGIRAVSMVGGSDMKEEEDALETEDTVVIVATPGRLEDHMKKVSLEEVKVLVLDEADQLAGEFFRGAVERITKATPEGRQVLLFSATIDDAVKKLAKDAAGEYAFLDFAKTRAAPVQIEQRYALVETEEMSASIFTALKKTRKAVAIFSTARIAEYYAQVFRRTDMVVYEVHARMSAEGRTTGSEEFREAESGVLFTSDISARGLDYPNVELVLQVGCPDSREDYLHRLGRTGRAGEEGSGLLLLHSFEEPFLEKLKDQPLRREEPERAEAPAVLLEPAEKKVMAEAYYSWLNHKFRNFETVPKLDILRQGFAFAKVMGALDDAGRTPRITEKNAKKMGVFGIEDPCVNIKLDDRPPEEEFALLQTGELAGALLAFLAEQPGKVVVFCVSSPVAMALAKAAEKALPSRQVWEAHERVKKKQKKANLAAFGAAGAGGVLFCADTKAATLPPVDVVLQVGWSGDEKQRRQRLMLAASPDGSGRAVTLLHAFERPKLPAGQELKELSGALPVKLQDRRAGLDAYVAWLAFFNRREGLSKPELLSEARAFAESLGMLEEDGRPPKLTRGYLKKLKGLPEDDPNLNLAED